MPLTWTLKQSLQTNIGLTFSSDRPLRHLKELQEIIKQRTGHKIALAILHNLLENQTKTLDYRILQIICDAFQFELKHFCTITPAELCRNRNTITPAELCRNIDFRHLLHPGGIAANESLRSFIIRVQLAAISQALLMTGTFRHAARLLGCPQQTLISISKRNQHESRNEALSTDNPIPLPANTFTIRENEDFQSLKRRIQLTAILETIRLERNHTRAALRLRYSRPGLVTLRYHLEKQTPRT